MKVLNIFNKILLELAGSWTREGPGQCDAQTNALPHEGQFLYYILLFFYSCKWSLHISVLYSLGPSMFIVLFSI
jgi:hypothetical protein